MSVKTEVVYTFSCDSCHAELPEKELTELRPASGRKGDALYFCGDCAKKPLQVALDLFAKAAKK